MLYRFEYHGWHYFTRCGLDGPTGLGSKLSEPVEPLFEHGSCRAFRFEHYGWHTVVHCDDGEPWAARRPTRSLAKIELLFAAQGCEAHRFEYYGWHYYVRCAGRPTVFTSNERIVPCGRGMTCKIEYEVQTARLPP